MFKQLPNFPLATHNFMPILIALDNECCRRARQWDLATCLVYLDEFYRVKKKQGPYAFPRHIVTQWTEMIMSNCSISVPHLMAYLHSLKLVRSFPKDLVQVKLENRLIFFTCLSFRLLSLLNRFYMLSFSVFCNSSTNSQWRTWLL